MLVILIKETFYSSSWEIASRRSYLRLICTMTTSWRLSLSCLIRKTDGIVEFGRCWTLVSLHLFKFLLSLFLINLRQLIRFEISNRYHVCLIFFKISGTVLLSHFSSLSERRRILGVLIECTFTSSVNSELKVVAARKFIHWRWLSQHLRASNGSDCAALGSVTRDRADLVTLSNTPWGPSIDCISWISYELFIILLVSEEVFTAGKWALDKNNNLNRKVNRYCGFTLRNISDVTFSTISWNSSKEILVLCPKTSSMSLWISSWL